MVCNAGSKLDHKNFYTVLDIPLARIKNHKNSRPSLVN